MSNVRTAVSSYYLKALSRRTRPLPAQAMDAPTLVVAPHQDDETLGCGGTIILKRRAGVAVRVVYLTDGSSSHAAHMPADQLSRLREDEALQACGTLGVDPAHVTFLRHPDGALGNHLEQAVQDLVEILADFRPGLVFLPHRSEPPADHVAANRIVTQAVKRSGQSATLCEYPVWMWNQWPFTNPLAPVRAHRTREISRSTVGNWLGFRLTYQFDHVVDVSAVLEQKSRALFEHRSQLTELIADVNWPTLAAVSDGEFLRRILQEQEFFRCQRIA